MTQITHRSGPQGFNVPRTYLGVTVPEGIKAVWFTWAGAEWRLAQHYNRGQFYPPDQRFSVGLPAGMCVAHRRMWLDWRDRWFKGVRFPGPPAGDGFCNARTQPGIAEDWDRARAEWDEKTIEQMRQVESICLSGRSAQCDRRIEVAA